MRHRVKVKANLRCVAVAILILINIITLSLYGRLAGESVYHPSIELKMNDFLTRMSETYSDEVEKAISDLYGSTSGKPWQGIEEPKSDVVRIFTEKEQLELEKNKEDFETLKSKGSLVPCRIDDGRSCFQDIASLQKYTASAIRLFSQSQTNYSDDRRVILRNPLAEDRFWCGKRIPGGGGTLEVKGPPDECGKKNEGSLPYVQSTRPPKIPGKIVSADEDGVRTVDLHMGKPNGKPGNFFACTVPCKLHKRSQGNFERIYVENTNWEFLYSMEGEVYYPTLVVDPTAYRRNKFYATTSSKSEIPLPYFSWAEYDIQKPAVDFHKAIKGASFIASNCNPANNREVIVKALMNTTLRIDSLGRCLHNTEPKGDKNAMMQRYLFHLAFENQNVDDYITEKLWGALQSGTLPVYLGAYNVKDHVPKNSIIDVQDFDSYEDLAAHLILLTEDKDRYDEYHKWRYKPMDEAFTEKFEFTNSHSICRICKWAFAKSHGLGWSHSKQTILKPRISRMTCLHNEGLVVYPFKESWLASFTSSKDGNNTEEVDVWVPSMDNIKTCTLNEGNRIIEADDGAIRRKVYDRDGVTDLIIDVKSAWTLGGSQVRSGFNSYILRLETPVKTGFVNQPPRVRSDLIWWLQDDQSRFSIMVKGGINVTARLSDAGPGIIDIHISPSPSNPTIWVRIVTEDLDHFHEGARDIPSYFGELMARDFLYPIESYSIRDNSNLN